MANGKGKAKLMKILSIFGSVAMGAVKGANPIVGMAVGAGKSVIESIKNEVEKNKTEDDAVVGAGNVNWAKLIPQFTITASIIGLIIALIFGAIEMNDFVKLFRMLLNNI